MSVGQHDLQLPEGACLLHIGPFKTGTTAIQGALQLARDQLPAHGALYPGTARRAARPGWAVLGRKQRGRAPVPIEEWEELAAEVRNAPHLRACVSTEDFGSASPEQAARIVRDLGGDRVHVVVVARRFDKLLPSHWQERVKSHDPIRYDDWLRAVLGVDEQHRAYRNFWNSHDLLRTYDRWTATVGHDRFHLVVGNDRDPEHLPRIFERMLALPDGLLQLAPYTNASLNYNGIELVRRLNEVFEERDWPDELYYPMLQRGLIQELMTAPPSPHEDAIPPLPPWATERAAELTEQRIKMITERGIHVVGDLDDLRLPSSTGTEEPAEDPALLSIESAALAVSGAVAGAMKRRKRRQREIAREARRLETARGLHAEPTGRQLLAELGRRVRRRVSVRGG